MKKAYLITGSASIPGGHGEGSYPIITLPSIEPFGKEVHPVFPTREAAIEYLKKIDRDWFYTVTEVDFIDSP